MAVPPLPAVSDFVASVSYGFDGRIMPRVDKPLFVAFSGAVDSKAGNDFQRVDVG